MYTDSYYTSPALLEELHRQNIGAYGTMNMKGCSPSVFEKGPLGASFRVTVLATVHDNLGINKRMQSKAPDGYRVLIKAKVS